MVLALVLALGLAGFAVSAHAEPWPAARIAALPDSAFAVVEIASDGRKLRHLPHHDETGAVDVPHLRAARGRWHQVRWLDPANGAAARDHLDAHWREVNEALDEDRPRRQPAGTPIDGPPIDVLMPDWLASEHQPGVSCAMRTTLTLDDDVVALLRREQARSKKPFKQLVNDALRSGLTRPAGSRARRKTRATEVVTLGRCFLPSLDDVAHVLAIAEGEGHR